MDSFPVNTELSTAKKLIDDFDLNSTFVRLVRVNKWSEKNALEAIKQYRRFLYLKKKYGDQYELPPSFDIDEAWHAHILHTEEYCNFCEQVFGKFLHHHPHHGKDNNISDQKIAEDFEITQKLYRLEFGEYIYAIKAIPLKVRFKRLFQASSKN
jgi:hypothetical protein